MPFTTSKQTTRNTGKTIVRVKAKQSRKSVFRKWGTLVNGTALYVKIGEASRSKTRIVKETSFRSRGKSEIKLNEPKEMNVLLKKLGASKMTAKECRKFSAHLST